MAADTQARGIAITRGEGADGPLTQILRARGARVLQWGSIAFAPPEDPAPFFEALEGLEAFDWICFSSPRAVDAVVSRIPEPPPGVKMAAVGPSTAKDLLAGGWPVDRVPEKPSGEGLVREFEVAGDGAGALVFFPASAIARDTLPRGLEALGARVVQVTAYQMVNLPMDREACAAAFEGGEVQVVTFASPSAMEGLRTGVGEELFLRLAGAVPAAALGATTADALRSAGWERVQVASDATLEGLAEAALGVDLGD